MTDESRVMVHHLKYEGLWRVADELARIVRRHCPRPLSGVLVPIPLGTRRLRERGYNQATILARAIGHQWEMPVSEHLLVRTRETRSQTTLTPHDRARNVADAFRSCVSGVGSRMPVILVDDVLTTGATLAEAARAMQQAGWGEIHAVTFARAMPFEVSVGMDDPPRKMRS
jgi:ComF family protein